MAKNLARFSSGLLTFQVPHCYPLICNLVSLPYKKDSSMSLSSRSAAWLLYSLSHLVLFPLPSYAVSTVSIESFPQYTELRGCAKCCFRACNAGCAFLIADILTCGGDNVVFCTNDAKDDCVCREDLQPVATTYLSSCVFSQCSSDMNDVTSAVKAYTNYCKSTGQVILATTTGTGQGAYTSTAAATSAVWSNTPVPTATDAVYAAGGAHQHDRRVLDLSLWKHLGAMCAVCSSAVLFLWHVTAFFRTGRAPVLMYRSRQ